MVEALPSAWELLLVCLTSVFDSAAKHLYLLRWKVMREKSVPWITRELLSVTVILEVVAQYLLWAVLSAAVHLAMIVQYLPLAVIRAGYRLVVATIRFH